MGNLERKQASVLSSGERGPQPGFLNSLTFIFLLGLLFVGLVSWGAKAAFLDAVVQPDPLYQEVRLGDTEVVAVSLANVTGLYALQMRLVFDPSHVQVVDVDPAQPGVQVGVGTILAGTDWQVLQNVADNTTGVISITASLTNQEASFDGSGSLVEVTFLGAALGSSAFQVDEVVLSDQQGLELAVTTHDGTLAVVEDSTPEATQTVTATPTQTPTVVPTGPARIEIVPSHRQVPVGLTTTVEVRIYGAVNLYGAEVHIRYDPSIVRVVDADPLLSGVQMALGGFPYPDYVPVNEAHELTGTLDCALTQVPPRAAVSGDGLFGVITFEALQGGISPVEIVAAKLSDPDGIEIPSVTKDGEIDVLHQGTIVGQVHFQGRSAPPSPDWSCPLSVTLYLPGETMPTYTFSPLTDQRGVFTVTNIVTGTYDVKVRDLHSLWNVRHNVAVDLGINVLDMGTLLEGDSDLNGVIDILDFSILAGAYDTSLGDPTFDPRADYNNSWEVNILDFALLATNYGLSGEHVLTGRYLPSGEGGWLAERGRR